MGVDVWSADIKEHFQGSPVKSALSKQAAEGRQKVEWSVTLPDTGKYEVFFYYTDRMGPELPSTERYRPGERPFRGSASTLKKSSASSSYRQRVELVRRDLGYYTVFDGEQEHEVLVAVSEDELYGWVSLGVYDCKKKRVSVTLSDKRVSDRGRGQQLVADAVKWVKVE